LVIRVAQLTDYTSHSAGGVFASVRGLATALQNESLVDVKVVARRQELSELDRRAWASVALVEVDVRGWHGLITGGQIPDLHFSNHVDVLHVHSLWTYAGRSVVNLLWRGVHVPYIVSPRGTLSPWALAHSRWKKQLSWPVWERKLLANTACVHALNEEEAEAIRAAGIRAPICIIPNGVALPEPVERRRDGRRRLLFLGRFHPKKGFRELVAAWHQIDSKLKAQWQLVVAGIEDAAYRGQYQALVAELADDDSIIFPGPAFGEKKCQLLRQAHAFILPSYSEGLPMAVLEAWAFGLPVLMTDACNLSAGFAHGAAVRIEPRVDNMASVLASFLAESDQTLESIGRAGRQLVEENFTWNRVAKEMAGVYHWIVGGDRPACVVL